MVVVAFDDEPRDVEGGVGVDRVKRLAEAGIGVRGHASGVEVVWRRVGEDERCIESAQESKGNKKKCRVPPRAKTAWAEMLRATAGMPTRAVRKTEERGHKR